MVTHVRHAVAVVCTLGCLCSCKNDPVGSAAADALAGRDSTMSANHSTARLPVIPEHWVVKAKSDLRIAYGHTSHGSQLVTGMNGLETSRGQLYAFNSTGSGGALQLRDTPFSGASDLGNPDRTAWEAATRTYLNAHQEINVVIWSWCGQVSSATESDITTYLALMSGLERDYPERVFCLHDRPPGRNGHLGQSV